MLANIEQFRSSPKKKKLFQLKTLQIEEIIFCFCRNGMTGKETSCAAILSHLYTRKWISDETFSIPRLCQCSLLIVLWFLLIWFWRTYALLAEKVVPKLDISLRSKVHWRALGTFILWIKVNISKYHHQSYIIRISKSTHSYWQALHISIYLLTDSQYKWHTSKLFDFLT